MTRVALFVLALANTMAAFAIGASRLDWPRGFWGAREEWVLRALVITAAVPLFQSAFSEYTERARRRGIEKREKLETILTAALIQMVRQAEADWETTGVQVFLVKRCGWLRQERHVRAAKVRLGASPSSGVDWPRRKGVIGRCWQTRRQQYEDLERQFRPYEDLSKEQWDQLSEKTRFGLTFEDFQRLGGKYGIVAAVPIVDRNDRYVGCLTADMPPRRTANKAEVLKTLTMNANLVKEVV